MYSSPNFPHHIQITLWIRNFFFTTTPRNPTIPVGCLLLGCLVSLYFLRACFFETHLTEHKDTNCHPTYVLTTRILYTSIKSSDLELLDMLTYKSHQDIQYGQWKGAVRVVPKKARKIFLHPDLKHALGFQLPYFFKLLSPHPYFYPFVGFNDIGLSPCGRCLSPD